MTAKIRVEAVDDLRVTPCASGVLAQGAAVGRDRKGNAIPGGELVEDSAYYRRRIARGELRLVPDAPPESAPAKATRAAAPSKASTTAGPVPDEG